MSDPPLEVRIGIGGNVDAGKSSFVGVMTKNILDNGRGYARSFVMKHKHEQETGRTSSATQQYIRSPECVIEFSDLAGHEKYYKCTAKEISNTFLDYVAIIINSGSGIQLMTREHIALAFSLRLPMFVIYSKIDSTPKNIYEINLEYIKSYYEKKMNLDIIVINTSNDLDSFLADQNKFTKGSNRIPLFPISNVSGQGLDIVRRFILGLEKYCASSNSNLENLDANFFINHTYNVPGIGLVVSGIMKSGTVKKGDVLYLGPNANGYVKDSSTNTIIATPSEREQERNNNTNTTNTGNTSSNANNFYKIVIKGIHNNFQENVEFLKAGYSGCFNIKPAGRSILKRGMIRQGMRILSNIHSVFQFEAKIKICNSSSTITKKYQPVMHCGGISQAVQIVKMDKEYLRSYDDAVITFRFLFRPEYLEIGNIFIMREGNLKALGKVIKIDC